MDISQNCLNEDLSKVKSKLDEAEKVVFALGQSSLKDFQVNKLKFCIFM